MKYGEVLKILEENNKVYATRPIWSPEWKIMFIKGIDEVVWYDGYIWSRYFPLEEEACADDWEVYSV